MHKKRKCLRQNEIALHLVHDCEWLSEWVSDCLSECAGNVCILIFKSMFHGHQLSKGSVPQTRSVGKKFLFFLRRGFGQFVKVSSTSPTQHIWGFCSFHKVSSTSFYSKVAFVGSWKCLLLLLLSIYKVIVHFIKSLLLLFTQRGFLSACESVFYFYY